MPTEVWNYYPQRDGTLVSEDGAAGSDPRRGAMLSFHRGDLGVLSLTVGMDFELVPRGFISRPNGYK